MPVSKGRHLVMFDRRMIEDMLRDGESVGAIAGKIGVSWATVAREIKRHRTRDTTHYQNLDGKNLCQFRGRAAIRDARGAPARHATRCAKSTSRCPNAPSSRGRRTCATGAGRGSRSHAGIAAGSTTRTRQTRRPHGRRWRAAKASTARPRGSRQWSPW